MTRKVVKLISNGSFHGNGDYDWFEYEFVINNFDANSASLPFKVRIKISGTLRACWGNDQSKEDLQKILLQVAEAKIKETIKITDLEISLEADCFVKCPYDPSAIKSLEGYSFEFDIPKQMGFVPD